MRCPRCKTLIKGKITHCHQCGAKFSFRTLVDDDHRKPNKTDDWSCKLCGNFVPTTEPRFSQILDEELVTFILKSDYTTAIGRNIASRLITQRPPIIIAPICQDCFGWIDLREKKCYDAKRAKHSIHFAAKAREKEKEAEFEEATTYFEMAGLWKDAAITRKKGRRRITKTPDIDLDDLISDMRRCEITMPYKCHKCGTEWTLDPSKPMGIKNRCETCGAFFDKYQIKQFLIKM